MRRRRPRGNGPRARDRALRSTAPRNPLSGDQLLHALAREAQDLTSVSEAEAKLTGQPRRRLRSRRLCFGLVLVGSLPRCGGFPDGGAQFGRETDLIDEVSGLRLADPESQCFAHTVARLLD